MVYMTHNIRQQYSDFNWMCNDVAHTGSEMNVLLMRTLLLILLLLPRLIDPLQSLV